MGTRTKRAKWPKIRSPALEFWHSIIFALSWSNFRVWNVPTLLHSVVHTSLKRKRRFLDPNPGSSRIKGVYFHSIFERTWIFKMSLHAGHYMVRCLHLILISAHRPFNVVHDEHIYHLRCQFIQQNRIHLTENYEHWVQLRCGISKSQLLIPCAFRVKWLWKILTFGWWLAAF